MDKYHIVKKLREKRRYHLMQENKIGKLLSIMNQKNKYDLFIEEIDKYLGKCFDCGTHKIKITKTYYENEHYKLMFERLGYAHLPCVFFDYEEQRYGKSYCHHAELVNEITEEEFYKELYERVNRK